MFTPRARCDKLDINGSRPLFVDGDRFYAMKIESIADAKARLSRLIKDLPKTGSVVIKTAKRVQR